MCHVVFSLHTNTHTHTHTHTQTNLHEYIYLDIKILFQVFVVYDGTTD